MRKEGILAVLSRHRVLFALQELPEMVAQSHSETGARAH